MRWIKCSDEMPKEGEMVLFATRRKKLYGDGGYERPEVECGNRTVIGSKGSWSVAYDMYYGDHWPDEDVTHWMPLPEPPHD